MKFGVIIAALAGLACAVGVVAYLGAGPVLHAASLVGWGGFALLCVYALGTYLPLGGAWRVLVAPQPGVRLDVFMGARLIRDAATELLPFSSLGGFVLGARAATLRGLPAATGFASSLVDLTTEFFAQIAFILLGVGLWMVRLHGHGDRQVTIALGAGVALFIVGGLAFFVLQRRVLRAVTGWMSRLVPAVQADTEAFQTKLEEIYTRRAALAWSSALHLAGWLASTAIVWLAFRMIGVDASFVAVITIEALICVLRSTAFFVPSAIGVQEVGYAFVAPLFGLPAEAGVAVSLLKRAREIVTGVIALLIWQAVESRRALRIAQSNNAS